MVGTFGVERDCNRLVAVLNGKPVGTCRDHLLSSASSLLSQLLSPPLHSTGGDTGLT